NLKHINWSYLYPTNQSPEYNPVFFLNGPVYFTQENDPQGESA
ncbi:5049_t:CDS:1, partial [Racocetra persica]